MSGSSRRFARDVVGTFVTRIVVLGLSVVTSVLLARALGAEGRGVVAALMVYPALLFSLFEGGFRQAAVVEVGRRVLPEGAVVGAVVLHFLLASTLSVMTVAALLTWVSPTTWTGLLVALAAGQVPVRLANSMMRGLLLGRQEVGVANLVERRARLGYAVVLVVLYVAGGLTVTTALAAGVVGQLAGLGVALRRLRALGVAAPVWVASVWVGMARRGAVFALGLFVIQLNYRLDVVLLERLTDAVTVGRYAVATQLGELLWQLPAAFGLVVFSRAAASDAAGDRTIVGEVARATRVSLTLVSLGALGMAALAPWVVPWVFGEAFTGSVPMLWALLPGVVALTSFKVLNALIAGRGAPRVAIFVMAPAVLVNVLLNLWWIPSFGGIGAASASSVSYALAGVAFAVYFAGTSGVAWSRMLVPTRQDAIDVGSLLARRSKGRGAR